MKDIIINQPHLQSFQQRLAAFLLTIASWLLWLYFLLPLVTLGGWLIGVKSLSNEIRWFGGYKTLLELLEMYGAIIVVIAVFWVFWKLYLSWRHDSITAKAVTQVTDQQLAAAFKVDIERLSNARPQQKLTVHFDNHAVITAIENQ